MVFPPKNLVDSNAFFLNYTANPSFFQSFGKKRALSFFPDIFFLTRAGEMIYNKAVS